MMRNPESMQEFYEGRELQEIEKEMKESFDILQKEINYNTKTEKP